MSVYLSGHGDYYIIDYEINPKIGGLHTASVVINSTHYFNIKYETGMMTIYSGVRTLFNGVITKLDFDFDNSTLTVYLTEYLKIIDFNYDLIVDTGSYEITYTSETIDTLLTVFLNGTIFSVGFVPAQTISELTGNNLSRIEWIFNMLEKTKAGIDANGDYTTTTGDIVSGEINCDLIIDYDALTVSIGVAGTTRYLTTANVWHAITTDITRHITTTPEFSDTLFKPDRIKVVGKTAAGAVVEGEAYITADTDLPVEVVYDDSCTDVAACETKAANVLNSYRKLSSLSIEVNPKLFDSGSIYLGQSIVITDPKELSNTYRLTEINATQDSVTLTLGNSKNWLVNQLRYLNNRVKNLERW